MSADGVEVQGVRITENTRQVLLAGVYFKDKAMESSFVSDTLSTGSNLARER
jgi:hypothetical protein